MYKINLPRSFTVFQSRYDGYCFYQYLDESHAQGQKVLVKVHVRALNYLPELKSAANSTPYFSVFADDLRPTTITIDDGGIILHYALEHPLRKQEANNG